MREETMYVLSSPTGYDLATALKTDPELQIMDPFQYKDHFISYRFPL